MEYQKKFKILYNNNTINVYYNDIYNRYNYSIFNDIFLNQSEINFLIENKIVNLSLFYILNNFINIYTFFLNNFNNHTINNLIVNNDTIDNFIVIDNTNLLNLKNKFINLYTKHFSNTSIDSIIRIIDNITISNIEYYKNYYKNYIIDIINNILQNPILIDDNVDILNIDINDSILLFDNRNILIKYNKINYNLYKKNINEFKLNENNIFQYFSILYFLYEKNEYDSFKLFYNKLKNEINIIKDNIININSKYIIELLKILNNPIEIYSYYDYILNKFEFSLLKEDQDIWNNYSLLKKDTFDIYLNNTCIKYIDYKYFDYNNKEKSVDNFILFDKLFKHGKKYKFSQNQVIINLQNENDDEYDEYDEYDKNNEDDDENDGENELNIFLKKRKIYFKKKFIIFMRLKRTSEKLKISRDCFYKNCLYPLFNTICSEIYNNYSKYIIYLFKNNIYVDFINNTTNFFKNGLSGNIIGILNLLNVSTI